MLKAIAPDLGTTMSKYEKDCPFFNRAYRNNDLTAGYISGSFVMEGGRVIVKTKSGPFSIQVELNCLACGLRGKVVEGDGRTPETARLSANENVEVFKKENDQNCRLNALLPL